MTTKKRQTSIYLPDELREQLEAIAEKEQRSLTFIIEQLLREALKARDDQ
jgi:predicted transcriptional regulator